MAKYSEETKYSALALLHEGKEPKVVAASTDVALATVFRWRKELEEAKANGTLDKIMDMDRALLGQLIDKVTEEAPSLQEAAGALTEKLDHSNRLKTELQVTALHIAKQAKTFAASADNSADLIILSEVICNLQVAFFNSNSTQINVQNNNGVPYSGFLSDAPEGV